MTDTTPDATEAVVTRFLDLLAEKRIDDAADLLAPDVAYTNVSLPTIHGRERVRRVAHASLGRRSADFEVYVHASAVRDHVVLNERTDVLVLGPLRVQFWVFGHFEVRDGLITVWRDAFDWGDMAVGVVRGLLGIVVRPLRRRPPRVA